MTAIEFPLLLKNLLEDSPLQSAIRNYANRAGDILDDKQMSFFPSYTDHSGEHINQVLLAEVALIPTKVQALCADKDRQQRLLRPEDAAVLIGGTLLHDIAMHLHPAGFLELVSADSRFKPLPWFKDEQQGHKADRLWRELWLDYQREARRFSDAKLGEIIGMDDVRQGWRFETLPQSTGQWQKNHHLVIGEFIRRHHARLAHEIAHYGFPGLEIGHSIQQFPALAERNHPLEILADLIGLIARSHWMDLRTCQAYLDSRYGKRGPRHRGCAMLYPMALLRVADYLQIDCSRTPAILLKLRNPQSPVSVQEWQKHLALLNIDEAHDPSGKSIEVSGQISHEVYLQLRELLDGLQKEMDHATAVLAEAYGRIEGLKELSLATRRVHSNLTEPAFRAGLPYVPERTGYSTDPNLLTLLVEPLYGKEPGVGVRELMQNSVDAVRELHAWCESHGKRVEDLDLPDQEADVQIDFIQREDESWFLRVTDKGIGMTADTIQNYFLRAGASFRQSSEWTKEFVDDDGKPKILRAGRFGIGAFAIFLLGPRFRLWTRHVTADKSQGYYLEAEGDSRGIEIRREEKMEIGTAIEVDITEVSASILGLEIDPNEEVDGANDPWGGIQHITEWFCWDWPIIGRRVIQGLTTKSLNQECVAPLREVTLPPEWSVIYPLCFKSVYWTFDTCYPKLICNGVKITNPDDEEEHDFLSKMTQLDIPKLSVLDDSLCLPLTVQRYSLSEKELPFATELYRDVTLSFIAHALICGPSSDSEAHELGKQIKAHPLALPKPHRPLIFDKQIDSKYLNGLRHWCSSLEFVIPADPWLYSLLRTNTCCIFGAVGCDSSPPKGNLQDVFLCLGSHHAQAIMSLNAWFYYIGGVRNGKQVSRQATENFIALIGSSLNFLGGNNVPMHVFVLLPKEKANVDMMAHLLAAKFGEERWSLVTHSKANRYCLELQTKTVRPSLSNYLIEAMDTYEGNNLDLVFAAKIETTPTNPQPETLLASLWNECLGPHPIPFDPAARQALIERGRQHPELKRHIEAWEEMKRTGLKWVYGADKA